MKNQTVAASTVEDLFGTHKRMLWGLSYRLTGCAADADDIVQETFIRAIHRNSSVSTSEALASFGKFVR